MARLLRSLTLIFLFASFAGAQTAIATRSVNLYPHPSADDRPITKLTKGTEVQFLEPDTTNNYAHIRTADSQTGFAYAKFLKVQAGATNAPTPSPSPTPGSSGETDTTGAPVPLLAKGHPVDWWFVFKLNSGVFPGCGGAAVQSCIFGGEVQKWKSPVSQQFVFASSESHGLQQGADCLGDTTSDPVGATFEEIYDGSFSYVVWNDQFYQDPKIAGCGDSCSAPWGHSKGMVAWNDAGEGLVMQVTTPDWPGAGSKEHPRAQHGNTLGCTKDNDIEVSQHFFSLRLDKDDLVKVLTALQNASVVTDTKNVQVVKLGGPAEVQALAAHLGVKSENSSVTQTTLSSGVRLISKPSNLHVPPWQMVSGVLGGVPLRTATWWMNPAIDSTTADTKIDCWDSSLGSPGAVAVATTGQWEGTVFGLKGGPSPNSNHAKIGVSTAEGHHLAIFGDMNQQGSISGKCTSSQNGRGGLFYVIDDATLADSVQSLIEGDTAPAQ